MLTSEVSTILLHFFCISKEMEKSKNLKQAIILISFLFILKKNKHFLPSNTVM